MFDDKGKMLVGFTCNDARFFRLVDWDGDGLSDILVVQSRKVFNGWETCLATLGPKESWPSAREMPLGLVADVDGDARPEIVEIGRASAQAAFGADDARNVPFALGQFPCLGFPLRVLCGTDLPQGHNRQVTLIRETAMDRLLPRNALVLSMLSGMLASPVLAAPPAKVASAAPAVPPGAAVASTNGPVAPMNPAGEGIATDVGIKSGGRHGAYSKMAATGPHMKVVAATFFGSEGYEEFVAAGGLSNGTVVAFGNAWGPQFPKNPDAVVLGQGTHTGQPAVKKDGKGNETPNYASADCAGMIVCFAEDLSAARKVVRMDWGVANIRAGLVTENGKGLIVAGQCHPAFRTFSAGCPKVNTLPFQAPPPDPKKRRPDPATLGDVYVARFAADTLKPEWVWVMERNGDPPEDVFVDKAGAVYFDAAGMRRISPDGAEMKVVNSKTGSGTAKWLGVDPTDGGAFFGGDRNTHTGQQPYRQPYMYKYDAGGNKVVTLWEPDPKTVGSATGGLESDSSPRAMAWAKTGDMLVGGWSDGGNSVFPRQALDWHKPATGGGMGMQTWGMKNANSLGHIMRIDPKTWETKSHTWWAAFIPSWFKAEKNRGAPNFANIRQIRVLNDGSVAITGSAATGLIQTPNGFWVDLMDGAKYGGVYVAVFLPDLTNLRFSSYLPGCGDASAGVTRKGIAVVSRSKGVDNVVARPTMSPVKNAIQKRFMGGTDAHIVVLELPPGAGR